MLQHSSSNDNDFNEIDRSITDAEVADWMARAIVASTQASATPVPTVDNGTIDVAVFTDQDGAVTDMQSLQPSSEVHVAAGFAPIETAVGIRVQLGDSATLWFRRTDRSVELFYRPAQQIIAIFPSGFYDVLPNRISPLADGHHFSQVAATVLRHVEAEEAAFADIEAAAFAAIRWDGRDDWRVKETTVVTDAMALSRCAEIRSRAAGSPLLSPAGQRYLVADRADEVRGLLASNPAATDTTLATLCLDSHQLVALIAANALTARSTAGPSRPTPNRTTASPACADHRHTPPAA